MNWFPRSGPLRAFNIHICCGVWHRIPQKDKGAKLGAGLPEPAPDWRAEPACLPSFLLFIHSFLNGVPTSPKTWR